MLSVWTIYDHPTDVPDAFVARCWVTIPGEPEPRATDNHVQSSTLKNVRMVLRMAGLTCLQRSNEDDPKIVESWI